MKSRCRDVPKLGAHTIDLHLVVNSSDMVQLFVRPPSHQVTCLKRVPAQLPVSKWKTFKPINRFTIGNHCAIFMCEVSRHNARARNVQLAWLSNLSDKLATVDVTDLESEIEDASPDGYVVL